MFNITFLNDVQPVRTNTIFKDYPVSWNCIRELKYIKDWLGTKTPDFKKFQKYNYYARVRLDFNDHNLIDSIVIAAEQQDFINICYMREPEILEALECIKNDNKDNNKNDK